MLSTVAVLATAIAAPASASAAEQNAYAAGMNYATPTINIGKGDTLTFNNLDNLAKHDLLGDNGAFGSELIGAGESAPVKGVEALEQGQFQFHCSLHGWMKGVLNVGPEGGGGPGGGGGAETPGLGSSAPDPVDIWPKAAKGWTGAGSWPMYGKDLSNSRNGGPNGPSVTEAANLGPAWSHYSSDGDFTGTPVVSHGMVIAASHGGTVVAVDAVSGKLRWSRDLIPDGQEGTTSINASVAVYHERIYVPVVQVGRPRLVALTLGGKVRFDTPIGDQPMMDTYGSPVGHGGRIFMGTSGYFAELSSDTKARGSVVAVHWKTGKLLWRTYTVPPDHNGGAVWSTPAVDTKRERLFVGTGNAYTEPAGPMTDSMLQLDPRNGRVVKHFQSVAGDAWNGPDDWPENPDADFGASPNLIEGPDGRELVGQGEKNGLYWALDRDSMEPVWSALTGPGTFTGGIVGSTAYDGSRIYGPDTHGGESWALDRGGRLNWLSADGGPLHFNATSTANGVVYTNDMSGFLVAREAATGLQLAKIPLGAPSWGGVSVAGGTVFAAVGTQGSSGYIVAYRPRTGNEATSGVEHYEDKPEEDPDAYLGAQERQKKCASARAKYKKAKKAGRKSAQRKYRRQISKRCKTAKKPAGDGEHDHHAGQEGSTPDNSMEGRGGAVLKANRERGDRYVPKPPGTRDQMSLYYGPYTIPPGWDANRVDLELPTQNGFLIALEPAMRRVQDLSEPMHTEAHIHHAHWFGFDPQNQEDRYFNQLGPGTHEWVFGNGDEETRADFRRRSAAQPGGPVYGNYIPAGRNQTVIYMAHNKTAQPMEVWIVLDVIFEHGTKAQLEQFSGREYHDVNGMLMGRTFNVPREPNGDGVWENIKDQKTADGKERPIEFVAPRDGTIIGTGGHLHPGGTDVVMENYGSKEEPCPADKRGRGYGGTLLLHSEIINRNAPLSEDYQTEVTHPAWRAPMRKGDRIRISGIYANKDHAYYYAMTHAGFYFDYAEEPKGRCKPYIVGPAKKKVKDPTAGVPNRPWTMEDKYCGWGDAPACEKPEEPPAEDAFASQNTVHVANFQYLPGDRSSSAAGGKIPSVKQGEQITFVNDDQFANIRHTITTCPWPCNGSYVANYPHADGAWDSDTLGYDPIDGGTPNPQAKTPADLNPGLYTYFCRIHPWMRGAFRVEPPGGMGGSSSLALPGG